MSALSEYVKNPARRAEFIFGMPMHHCPQCASYKLRIQTPIVMEEILPGDSPRRILGKWARASKGGATPLEGPVYIMCADCGHKGPSVDCKGRTREDVGKDAAVSAKVKRLWNEQTHRTL